MSIGKNLKYVPKQKLIEYVQDPHLAAAADIPAASALFELQQRVELEKENAALKARENMRQGPQSVADKTIAASQQTGIPSAMNMAQNNMADTGVASLDTGDMYDEKNYAGGGIVAFDDGGDVDIKTRSQFTPYTNEEQQILAAKYLLGADLGNNKASVGADYTGSVDQRGATVPTLSELRGNYMTDEGTQYGARYNPDARNIGIDRNTGITSMSAAIAPGGRDNSMGLRSIRGSYITDNGTRYGANYNVDSRQALLERINREGNALGFNVSPDRVGIQGQYNFARGGEVKHFAYGKGVKTDPELYDPTYYQDAAAALVPTRQIPTADDYFMEKGRAETALGIDPEYYKKRIADVESRNKEETDSAKRMANANILFAMADKLSTTPGSLMRGLSTAMPAGLKAGTEGLKELRDIDRLKQAAMDKLNDAKYAQDRGDVQAYMKHMEDYKTINANIEMKNAELETSVRVANVKKRADMAGKGAEIQSKIYDKFIKDFLATYPNGAQSTVFKSNPQFLQKEKNRILKNAQDYIISGSTPEIPMLHH